MFQIKEIAKVDLAEYFDFSATAREAFLPYLKERASELGVKQLCEPTCDGRNGLIKHTLLEIFSYFKAADMVTYAHSLILDDTELKDVRTPSQVTSEQLYGSLREEIGDQIGKCTEKCSSIKQCTIRDRLKVKI